jgi:hypothetical protein
MKKGADRKNVQMPEPSDFFYTILYNLFKIAPCFTKLSYNAQRNVESDLPLEVKSLVGANMKTDLKGIQPFSTEETNIF